MSNEQESPKVMIDISAFARALCGIAPLAEAADPAAMERYAKAIAEDLGGKLADRMIRLMGNSSASWQIEEPSRYFTPWSEKPIGVNAQYTNIETEKLAALITSEIYGRLIEASQDARARGIELYGSGRILDQHKQVSEKLAAAEAEIEKLKAAAANHAAKEALFSEDSGARIRRERSALEVIKAARIAFDRVENNADGFVIGEQQYYAISPDDLAEIRRMIERLEGWRRKYDTPSQAMYQAGAEAGARMAEGIADSTIAASRPRGFFG